MLRNKKLNVDKRELSVLLSISCNVQPDFKLNKEVTSCYNKNLIEPSLNQDNGYDLTKKGESTLSIFLLQDPDYRLLTKHISKYNTAVMLVEAAKRLQEKIDYVDYKIDRGSNLHKRLLKTRHIINQILDKNVVSNRKLLRESLAVAE